MALAVLAALVAACTGDGERPRGGATPRLTTQTTTAAPARTTTAPSTGPTTTLPVTTAAVTTEPTPTYRATVSPLPDDVRATMTGTSWRPGCPVGLDSLRLLELSHWDLAGTVQVGRLVVHQDHAEAIAGVFGQLFAARFPIERMQLIDAFGADDDASMAANNTSAFNCRRVSGSAAWSEHAYGRAVDINPRFNPWVRAATVEPPNGAAFADRSQTHPGMIQPGDAVVQAFAAVGWSWGGDFQRAKDYQHFSATGR